MKRSGISLIEVTVSTLLIGLVLVAALDTAGSAVRTTLATSTQLEGHSYAAELMAEIMAMPYCDPEEDDPDGTFGIESDEPPSPTNRLAFDDIDDYDDWSEPSALARRDGAARLDTAGWGRSVNINKLSKNDPATVLVDSAIDQGARRVTVTVTAPDGATTLLQTIRSDYGGLEQAPAIDTTFVTGVLIEIESTSGAASDAAAIVNHASGP